MSGDQLAAAIVDNHTELLRGSAGCWNWRAPGRTGTT